MDNRQAKEILLRYRPGVDDGSDPEIGPALELARRDPELGRWFERQVAVQELIRTRLRAIAPPAGLKEQILAERNIIHVPAWQRLALPVAAAAAVALLLALALWPHATQTNGFAAFRDRVVRSGLRDYRMDVLTKDLSRIRDYLARNQACGDFVLSEGLSKLPPVGCALRTWHGQRAAMVCFDRGRNEVLFLYVVNRSAVSGAPDTASPQFARVNKLMTASWSAGDKTYVLAGQGDEESLRQYR